MKGNYFSISLFHVLEQLEVISGHIFGHGEVKWPLIGQRNERSNTELPFFWYVTWNVISKSHCYGHGGHLRSYSGLWWGQMTSNWSKTLKGWILKSLTFIWYGTWHGISKSHCCGHGGHLRSHFQSWWGLKHWKVEYWSHYVPFDMSHDMGYEKVIVEVMELFWGHIFDHGEVKWPPIGLKHWKVKYWSYKWPPIGLKHWKVKYWSYYLSFDMSIAMVWFFFVTRG